MGFFKDALGIFKKRELLFLERHKESENIYTFVFEKDKDVTWKAGQYGLFEITHKSIKNSVRPFSVVTAPTENTIKITTRISDNPSDFKKALMELEKGVKIKMSGPVGSFYFKDISPTLMIAGGIGITPFRSMLKQIEAEGKRDELQMNLLYMDSQKLYLFQNELDNIASKTSIRVTYLVTRDDLHREIDLFTTSHMNNGKYFIAGPKSMVDLTFTHLRNHNISKRNIKKDVFFGY